jgi:hypothetical protein
LAQSAVECTASANIELEPVIAAAMYFVTAMAKFAPSA